MPSSSGRIRLSETQRIHIGGREFINWSEGLQWQFNGSQIQAGDQPVSPFCVESGTEAAR